VIYHETQINTKGKFVWASWQLPDLRSRKPKQTLWLEGTTSKVWKPVEASLSCMGGATEYAGYAPAYPVNQVFSVYNVYTKPMYYVYTKPM
jgi:hypothetical protein